MVSLPSLRYSVFDVRYSLFSPQLQIHQYAIQRLGRHAGAGGCRAIHGAERKGAHDGAHNKADLKLTEKLARTDPRAVPESKVPALPEPIAIIGLSGSLPKSATVDDFWLALDDLGTEGTFVSRNTNVRCASPYRNWSPEGVCLLLLSSHADVNVAHNMFSCCFCPC